MANAFIPLVAAAALGWSGALLAQGPTRRQARIGIEGCAVSTCGLEISNGMFFNATVHRADGESALVGLTGSSVVSAVNGVPDAVEEAMAGRRHAIVAATSAGVGISALLVGLWLSSRNQEPDLPAVLGVLAIGLGGTSFSVPQRHRAAEAFDRAVWLYNGALKRPAMAAPPPR